MTQRPDRATALGDELRARIRGKAKPIGSLGRLEDLAVQIGMIARFSRTPTSVLAKILVFAGDHGITAEGVTAYPSVVTREIAKLDSGGHRRRSTFWRAQQASASNSSMPECWSRCRRTICLSIAASATARKTRGSNRR